MPTNADETMFDRLRREQQALMEIYAAMTPDQIADMALELHNALAGRDKERERAAMICHACRDLPPEVIAERILDRK